MGDVEPLLMGDIDVPRNWLSFFNGSIASLFNKADIANDPRLFMIFLLVLYMDNEKKKKEEKKRRNFHVKLKRVYLFFFFSFFHNYYIK